MTGSILIVISLLVGAEVIEGRAVPAVISGPELAAKAQVVDAPIDRVTVFSDRARIERRATLPAGKGIRAVRLPDLPGTVLLDTIRLKAKGARVLRVEASPIERSATSMDTVADQVKSLETLEAEIRRLEGRTQVHGREIRFLDSISPTAPVGEEHRVGKAPSLRIERWSAVLSAIHTLRNEAEARRQAVDVRLRAASKTARALRVELMGQDLSRLGERRTRVVAVLDVKAGTPSIHLAYFVPQAEWRPSYSIELDATGQSLTLRTRGLVKQATREDWVQAKMALSTAIPGQGIELPELLTWTLGEKKEFMPQVYARQRYSVATLGVPTLRPDPEAAERELKLEALVARIHASKADKKQYKSNRRAEPPPPPMKPAPMPVSIEADEIVMPAPRGDAMRTVQNLPGVARRQSMDFAEEQVVGSLNSPPVYRTPMNLFERATMRPNFPNYLPAALAGGLDYTYEAPTRGNVPSGKEQHVVPLAVDTYPITTYYEATPGIQPTAYLKAAVKNGTNQPLLAGPVDIFVGADFIGSGRLETTGPGGTVEFPLGADEDIQIERTVKPKTVTKGVFSTDEITTYRTEVQVGNYKKRPISIRIYEPLPRADHEDIKVVLKKTTPTPIERQNDGQILVFELKIPAGKTQTVRFDYVITRPENFQMRQR